MSVGWRPEEDKGPGWAKADEAEALERRAEPNELRREALSFEPAVPECHTHLCERCIALQMP